MPKKPLKIIGINPGSRYLGIAIFQGSDLRDWRVKTFKEKWSQEKKEKIVKVILRFIDHHKPNILAIKKLHPSRSSKNLNLLVAMIQELCKRRGIRVCQYSIEDMNNFILQEEKANREKMAKRLISEYPDLFHDFEKENKNKNPYYSRMFEAVALASMCFHQIDKK
jgi:Holliday junction resolvasome RuvABC endonuclease subunit